MFSNHTAHINKKQAPNKSAFFGQQNSTCDIPDGITADPVAYFKACLNGRIQVLNGLIETQGKRGPGFVSTTVELADICGVHPSTVTKQIRALKELGLIATHGDYSGRAHMINPWFYQPEIKRLLSPMLKSLQYFSIILLASTMTQIRSRDFRPVDEFTSLGVYRDIYINNYNSMGAIRDIENLSLTQAGRITLLAFPAQAIEHADRVLGWCTRVKNRFNFFVKCCWKWSNEHGFKPLWRSTVLQRRTWGVRRDQAMVKDPDVVLRELFSEWDNTQPWKGQVSQDIKTATVGKKIDLVRRQVNARKSSSTLPSGSIQTISDSKSNITNSPVAHPAYVRDDRHTLLAKLRKPPVIYAADDPHLVWSVEMARKMFGDEEAERVRYRLMHGI